MWPQLVGSYSDSPSVAFPPGVLFISTYGIYIICIFICMYLHISELWMFVCFNNMWTLPEG